MENAQATLIRNVLAMASAKGWSLNRLADAAGISHGSISYFARGETAPSLTTITRLAAALDAPVAALFWPEDLVPFAEARRMLARRGPVGSRGDGARGPLAPPREAK